MHEPTNTDADSLLSRPGVEAPPPPPDPRCDCEVRGQTETLLCRRGNGG